MKKITQVTKILTNLLFIMALAVGQQAWASSKCANIFDGSLGNRSINVNKTLQNQLDLLNGNYLTQDVNDESYLIYDETDWNNLADFVKAGNTCSGLTFKLMEDISVSTTMGYQTGSTASTRQRFAGTFDGNNNTLTVTLSSNDSEYNHNYCAPFAYVDNFTVRNLHVTGTITTDGQFAGGLCGSCTGLVTVENCQVSVEMTSTLASGNGNHGGFVGIAENGSYFENCWFDGKFLGSNFKYSGGFVGINKVNATLVNCLFNPSEISLTNGNSGEGACTFIHLDKTSLNMNLTNAVYYVTQFGEEQGLQALEDEPFGLIYEPVTCADNNIYYVITGNPIWRQLQADLNDDTVNEITLTEDVVAAGADVALVVPGGRVVTINLNGYKINRNLINEGVEDNGNVITVSANSNLTINGDQTNGGTITGGYNNVNGGGIINNGVLTLNYVTLTNNTTTAAGGGIYNGTDATLNLYDSKIKQNNSNITGGGLYLQGPCHFERAEISNNTVAVNTNGYGGGVYVANGNLYMTDCTVNANSSRNQGGGIYVNSGNVVVESTDITNNMAWATNTGGGVYIMGGTFTFHDGSITGNGTDKGDKNKMRGAGVLVNSGTFNISGLVNITGNHFKNHSEAENNVYLVQNNIINIDGSLDPSSSLGITMGRNGVFTSGLNGNGYDTSFFSDLDNLWVGPTSDGEAILGQLVTVSFDGNNAQGEMNDFEYIVGAGWTLPQCTFSQTGDDSFDCWNTESDGSGTNYEDQALADLITEDVTLYAIWNKALNLDNDANNISSMLVQEENNFCKVTLTNRTLYKDNEWNTLCLPFNVTLEGSILEGATAKTMEDAIR